MLKGAYGAIGFISLCFYSNLAFGDVPIAYCHTQELLGYPGAREVHYDSTSKIVYFYDGRINAFDEASGKILKQSKDLSLHHVWSLNTDGSHLYITVGGTFYVYDKISLKEIRRIELPEILPGSKFTTMAHDVFVRNGDAYIKTVDMLVVYDLANQKITATYEIPHTGSPQSLDLFGNVAFFSLGYTVGKFDLVTKTFSLFEKSTVVLPSGWVIQVPEFPDDVSVSEDRVYVADGYLGIAEFAHDGKLVRYLRSENMDLKFYPAALSLSGNDLYVASAAASLSILKLNSCK